MKRSRLYYGMMLWSFFIIMLFNGMNSPVYAQNTVKEMAIENFSFYERPVLIDMNKVILSLAWETELPITYLRVDTHLQNNQIEYSYESGRDNIANYIVTAPFDDNPNWKYQLDYSINFRQIGTVKIVFEYHYMADIDNEVQVEKIFYLSTGRWLNDEAKQPFGKALLTGIIITGCAGLATYIIIENSQTSILPNDDEEAAELEE